MFFVPVSPDMDDVRDVVFDTTRKPVPEKETREIHASIYKKLMQKTLTVDHLKKWEEYLNDYIIIPRCDNCVTDCVVELRKDPEQDFIEEIATLIVEGKCPCIQDEDDECQNEGYKLVHLACMRDEYLPILMFLQTQNCDFNSKCSGNVPTPLHLAIYHGLPQSVDFLLARDVDVNFTSNYIDSPLAVAMATENDEIVNILLECLKVDKNVTNRRNQTVLAHCVRVKSIYLRSLLEAGADPNITGPLRTSPLMYAVQMRNADTVKLLLSYGADVNMKNGREDVPLLIALYTGDAEIMKILLDAGADPNYCHSDGNTPLLIACYEDKVEIIELLLKFHANVSKGNSNGYTPVHIAAWNGYLEIVKKLIEAGASHDIQTNDKNTPMALAAHGGHLKVIEELLPLGCRVNNYDKDDDTPLHYATYNGMVKAVELLIEHGADPNCKSTCNATPIWNAVYKGHKEVVKLLIKQNVILEVESKGTNQHSRSDHVIHVYQWPKSPLWVAMDRGFSDIALLLVSAGYNIYKEEWLVNGVITSSFDMRMWGLLSEYVNSPPQLIALCRNYFRQFFGRDIVTRTEQMDIPITLKKYLTFSDLQYQVNEKESKGFKLDGSSDDDSDDDDDGDD